MSRRARSPEDSPRLPHHRSSLPTRARTGRIALLALLSFTVIFGVVVTFKLNQEWNTAVASAERVQASTAAFTAERVSARIAEARGASSFAAADLESAPADRLSFIAELRLQALVRSPYIAGAALLTPGGATITVGAPPADLRTFAAEALEAPSGLLTSAGPDVAVVGLAMPAPLSDGSVGALVALLDTATLLPERRDGQVTVLADTDGRTLAARPARAASPGSNASGLFDVEPAQLDELVSAGGALRGAAFRGEPTVLGAATLADAPMQTFAAGRGVFDASGWRRTLIFHFLLFLAPVCSGFALYALLMIQVGDVRAMQEKLETSEQRLRAAIEGARCGVWDWNLDEDAVFMTDSFARMTGRAGEARLSGDLFLKIFREEDRSRLRAALRGASQSDEIDLEVRAASLPVWLHMRGRPQDPAEQGERRIVGVAIDVTERKGAQARVAAAESRLRAALESMSESFVLWDSRRRLVLWNKKFREFFGFAEGQLRPGMNYEAVEDVASGMIRAVHGAESGRDAYELELADNRWLHYSERETADGGLVSVGADISELKRKERALKENDRAMRRTVEDLKRSQQRIEELAKSYEEEKIRAEEANRSKSEFLANMSHELRTPLNAINGFSEIMLKEMFGPLGHERYSDYVKDILSSGQHLLLLINDILDMSKIEAGKMQLQSEPMEPSETLRQCLRLMRGRAEEKRLTLVLEAEELKQIEADPRAVKQVLLNLMSNALKFTPEGGKVILRGFEAADGVVLQVADTGIGISAEDLPRLGRPFEQIESHHSKSHQGSGLGLALSKSLVEMHGGSLRIDSVLGKGTTVSFTLPAKPRKRAGPMRPTLSAPAEREIDSRSDEAPEYDAADPVETYTVEGPADGVETSDQPEPDEAPVGDAAEAPQEPAPGPDQGVASDSEDQEPPAASKA